VAKSQGFFVTAFADLQTTKDTTFTKKNHNFRIFMLVVLFVVHPLRALRG